MNQKLVIAWWTCIVLVLCSFISCARADFVELLNGRDGIQVDLEASPIDENGHVGRIPSVSSWELQDMHGRKLGGPAPAPARPKPKPQPKAAPPPSPSLSKPSSPALTATTVTATATVAAAVAPALGPASTNATGQTTNGTSSGNGTGTPPNQGGATTQISTGEGDVTTAQTAGQGTDANKVATPRFVEISSHYILSANLHVECDTEGAVMFFTVDGTDPTRHSERLRDEIFIDAIGSVTIKVMAVKAGMEDSDVAVKVIEVEDRVATPTWSATGERTENPYNEKADDAFLRSATITINCVTVGATIYYTVDGETKPDASSRFHIPAGTSFGWTEEGETFFQAVAEAPGKYPSRVLEWTIVIVAPPYDTFPLPSLQYLNALHGRPDVLVEAEVVPLMRVYKEDSDVIQLPNGGAGASSTSTLGSVSSLTATKAPLSHDDGGSLNGGGGGGGGDDATDTTNYNSNIAEGGGLSSTMETCQDVTRVVRGKVMSLANPSAHFSLVVASELLKNRPASDSDNDNPVTSPSTSSSSGSDTDSPSSPPRQRDRRRRRQLAGSISSGGDSVGGGGRGGGGGGGVGEGESGGGGDGDSATTAAPTDVGSGGNGGSGNGGSGNGGDSGDGGGTVVKLAAATSPPPPPPPSPRVASSSSSSSPSVEKSSVLSSMFVPPQEAVTAEDASDAKYTRERLKTDERERVWERARYLPGCQASVSLQSVPSGYLVHEGRVIHGGGGGGGGGGSGGGSDDAAQWASFGIRDSNYVIGHISRAELTKGTSGGFTFLVSGYGWLVRDGLNHVEASVIDGDFGSDTSSAAIHALVHGRMARTALAHDGEGRLMLVQIAGSGGGGGDDGDDDEDGVDLFEFADILTDVGAVNAVNMVGGPYAVFMQNGTMIVDPGGNCSSSSSSSAADVTGGGSSTGGAAKQAGVRRDIARCERPVAAMACVHLAPPPIVKIKMSSTPAPSYGAYVSWNDDDADGGGGNGGEEGEGDDGLGGFVGDDDEDGGRTPADDGGDAAAAGAGGSNEGAAYWNWYGAMPDVCGNNTANLTAEDLWFEVQQIRTTNEWYKVSIGVLLLLGTVSCCINVSHYNHAMKLRDEEEERMNGGGGGGGGAATRGKGRKGGGGRSNGVRGQSIGLPAMPSHYLGGGAVGGGVVSLLNGAVGGGSNGVSGRSGGGGGGGGGGGKAAIQQSAQKGLYTKVDDTADDSSFWDDDDEENNVGSGGGGSGASAYDYDEQGSNTGYEHQHQQQQQHHRRGSSSGGGDSKAGKNNFKTLVEMIPKRKSKSSKRSKATQQRGGYEQVEDGSHVGGTGLREVEMAINPFGGGGGGRAGR